VYTLHSWLTAESLWRPFRLATTLMASLAITKLFSLGLLLLLPHCPRYMTFGWTVEKTLPLALLSGQLLPRKRLPSGLWHARYQATSGPRRARHTIFISLITNTSTKIYITLIKLQCKIAFIVYHQTGQFSGNALDSYSEVALFKSHPRHWLQWLRFFMAFLHSSRHIPG
jgi:hypothetical protein